MLFLRIKFPFTIEGSHPEVDIQTEIERKEDVVSFRLAYSMNISVKNAKLMLKEEEDGFFVYTYRFTDVNTAMDFMEKRAVDAVEHNDVIDVDLLEKEMDEFMEIYEAGERAAKKKKTTAVVTGKDGFMRCV